MSKTLDNAVRLVADFVVIPGTSQILKGEYKSGLIHAGVGLASRAFLASPIGVAVWLVTAANSYAMSSSEQNFVGSIGKNAASMGKNLVASVTSMGSAASDAVTDAAEDPAPAEANS